MNDKIELKEGDIVRLISGGPTMAIDFITNNGTYAECVWFDVNLHPVQSSFKTRLLVICDEVD